MQGQMWQREGRSGREAALVEGSCLGRLNCGEGRMTAHASEHPRLVSVSLGKEPAWSCTLGSLQPRPAGR